MAFFFGTKALTDSVELAIFITKNVLTRDLEHARYVGIAISNRWATGIKNY